MSLTSGSLGVRKYGNRDLIEDEIEDELNSRQALDVEEMMGRMDFETDDYPGSGANNRHDPKSPGKPY
ncbi:hypothetical protein J5N97_022650 [Dioscorea zingiberensis]|uniref:Uncharacterized protein n=1 Tax=Dioscorea zingiberensis TaxID=325984 RepID=A0A9D5CBL8_9LILI|nr:hypothetical protein J5N97_022650 [Dioscorea zingiberensis]